MNIIIENIVYKSDDNYYILSAINKENNEIITILGYFDNPIIGLEYYIDYKIKFNEKYGTQYEVINYCIIEPKEINDIYEYLSSGIIKGIKQATALKIVEYFGENSLNIIKNEPDRLLEIDGIGKITLENIKNSYKNLIINEEIGMFLTKLGFSQKQILKIFNFYENNTINIIKENPFELLNTIEGIGLNTIDLISKKLGIAQDNLNRIKSLIIYKLNEEFQNGHFYVKLNYLYNLISNSISNNKLMFDEAVKDLIFNKQIIVEKELNNLNFNENNDYNIFLYKNYKCEIGITEELYRISKSDSFNLDTHENFSNIELNNEQKEALNNSLKENIFILTGGPGTGKTTILKEIVMRAKKFNKNVLLAAPTGRAASRLQEATNESASTIHRLLEYNYSEDENILIFNKNKNNPLEADIIIIDEVSMIDAFLFLNLLKAISKGTKLILIGDFNQLPSVGAGNILEDLINSKLINTYCLTKIHRQSENSLIIKNAHAILNNTKFEFNNSNKDFFLIDCNINDLENELIELYSKRLPQKYNLNPKNDIMILTSYRKNNFGCEYINKIIQKEINKNAKIYFENENENITHKKNSKYTFFIDDKVMQMVNNYTLEYEIKKLNKFEKGKGIFNGEIGSVIDINDSNLIVEFNDNKIVKYEKENLENLALAYSLTIHKSQGNEFDYCIISIKNMPNILKNKKIIYTAITRAKKMVIILGSKEEFLNIINSNKFLDRRTNLCQKLNILYKK